MLQLVLLQAFGASSLFLLTAWLPAHLMQLAGMAPSTALLIQTISMAVLCLCSLLGGRLAEEWGCTTVLLSTCAVAVLYGVYAWLMLGLAVPEMAALAAGLLCVTVGLHVGALTGALTEAFPRGVSEGEV